MRHYCISYLYLDIDYNMMKIGGTASGSRNKTTKASRIRRVIISYYIIYSIFRRSIYYYIIIIRSLRRHRYIIIITIDKDYSLRYVVLSFVIFTNRIKCHPRILYYYYCCKIREIAFFFSFFYSS